MATSSRTALNQVRWHQDFAGTTAFCDCDGPILDVSNRYYSTYQLVLASVKSVYQTQDIDLEIKTLDKAQFWQLKQNHTPDPEIAKLSGLQPNQIEFYLQQVQQIVNQPTMLHEDCLQLKAVEAIKLLHTHGIRLVLVTLRYQKQATQILQDYSLWSLFSGVCGWEDDRAAYRNLADAKVHLLKAALAEQIANPNPPKLAWMIGDTEADVLAGQAAGIPTIALTCGIRSRSYLEQFHPTYIFDDLLAAAHHLLGPVSALSN